MEEQSYLPLRPITAGGFWDALPQLQNQLHAAAGKWFLQSLCLSPHLCDRQTPLPEQADADCRASASIGCW